jgi:hypothetical protein
MTHDHFEKHYTSTDAERVEILNENPYRFHLMKYLWVSRGELRQKELDEIHERSVENEDYELCIRIIEVKAHLYREDHKRGDAPQSDEGICMMNSFFKTHGLNHPGVKKEKTKA